jgi:hypothetical protein
MARTIDPETTEGTTDTGAQNGKGGWEIPTETDNATPLGTGELCGTPGAPFKRHRWDGDICKRCGAVKSAVSASGERKSSGSRTLRGSGKASNTIETIASLCWMGAGMGFEYLPTRAPLIGRLAEPVERTDGTFGAAPSVAVGRVMQLEASIAGKRIDSALRGTPVGKFIVALLNATGPWAELAPLFLPPLMVGIAAMYPELAERFKGLMVAAMIPVLTEASKNAEAQAALMSQLEGVNAETVAQAAAVVDSLLGIKADAAV